MPPRRRERGRKRREGVFPPTSPGLLTPCRRGAILFAKFRPLSWGGQESEDKSHGSHERGERGTGSERRDVVVAALSCPLSACLGSRESA